MSNPPRQPKNIFSRRYRPVKTKSRYLLAHIRAPNGRRSASHSPISRTPTRTLRRACAVWPVRGAPAPGPARPPARGCRRTAQLGTQCITARWHTQHMVSIPMRAWQPTHPNAPLPRAKSSVRCTLKACIHGSIHGLCARPARIRFRMKISGHIPVRMRGSYSTHATWPPSRRGAAVCAPARGRPTSSRRACRIVRRSARPRLLDCPVDPVPAEQ